MDPGIVVGRVVSTQKYHTLHGFKLLIVQPTDWKKKIQGDPIIAVDTVGAGAEEFVFYVSAREAAYAALGSPPVDAAIMGIIDGVHLNNI